MMPFALIRRSNRKVNIGLMILIANGKDYPFGLNPGSILTTAGSEGLMRGFLQESPPV